MERIYHRQSFYSSRLTFSTILACGLFSSYAAAGPLFFQNLGMAQAGGISITNSGSSHTATRTKMEFYDDGTCGNSGGINQCSHTDTSGGGFMFSRNTIVHVSASGVYTFASGASCPGGPASMHSVDITPYYFSSGYLQVFTTAACLPIDCTSGTDCTGNQLSIVTLS